MSQTPTSDGPTQLQFDLGDQTPPRQFQKYVKRPIPVEAVQLRWDTWSEVCDFLGDEMFAKGAKGCFVYTGPPLTNIDPANPAKLITADVPLYGDVDDWEIGCYIPTLEGTMLARQDDYIIKGIKGEFYPCAKLIFEESYEVYTD